jgi:hypothetical protein
MLNSKIPGSIVMAKLVMMPIFEPIIVVRMWATIMEPSWIRYYIPEQLL